MNYDGEQLYYAVIPEDTHLAESKDMEGAFRGAYFDEYNHLEGQANFVPVDVEMGDGIPVPAGGEDLDDAAIALAIGVGVVAAFVVGVVVGVAVAPKVKRWWQKKRAQEITEPEQETTNDEPEKPLSYGISNGEGVVIATSECTDQNEDCLNVEASEQE